MGTTRDHDLKSILAKFLVDEASGPSYNDPGNNNWRDLPVKTQFKSKEIGKSNVVDDVNTNRLYRAPEVGMKRVAVGKGEYPDHVIIIKYIITVDDFKHIIDEPKIFCGGRSTINVFNECEDSLVATSLIPDPAELLTRVKYYQSRVYSVLLLLSYMLKPPL